MAEVLTVRTRISKGYQVVVPSAIRKRFRVEVGDEVLWKVVGKSAVTEFRRKPSVTNILGIGQSAARQSAVDLKRRIQKGEG